MKKTFEARYKLTDQPGRGVYKHVVAASEQEAKTVIMWETEGHAFDIYLQHVPALAAEKEGE